MSRYECRVTFDEDQRERYNNPKRYSYLTDRDDLEKGQPVIVHANGGYSIAYFYDYEATGKGQKWLIDKVDVEKHVQLIEEEKKYQVIKKELDLVKGEMLKRKAMLEEEAIFKILAETDPVMAELLNKMNEIKTKGM